MSPAQDDRGVNRRLNLPKFSPPLISLLAASSHSPTCARCEPQFNHCCRAWALGAAGTPLERLRGGFLGSQRAPMEPCPSAGACCSLILPPAVCLRLRLSSPALPTGPPFLPGVASRSWGGGSSPLGERSARGSSGSFPVFWGKTASVPHFQLLGVIFFDWQREGDPGALSN